MVFLFSFRFSTVTREEDFHPLISIHLNSASAVEWQVTFMKGYERSHTAKEHTFMKWTIIIYLALRLAKDLPEHDARRLCGELSTLQKRPFTQLFTELYLSQFSHCSVKDNEVGSQYMFRNKTKLYGYLSRGSLTFSQPEKPFWVMLTHSSSGAFMTSLVWFIDCSLPFWCAVIQVQVEHEVQHVSKLPCEKEKGWQMMMSIRYVSQDSLSNR